MWQPGLAGLAGDGPLPERASLLLRPPGPGPARGAAPLQDFSASLFLFFLSYNNCFDFVNRQSIHRLKCQEL